MKLDLCFATARSCFPARAALPGSLGIKDGRIAALLRRRIPTRRPPTIVDCTRPLDHAGRHRSARALRLRLARDGLRDRVALGGAGRRDVGAVLLPHGRLPHRVRRLSRQGRGAELHRLRPALRHHQPPARGDARGVLAPLRRHLVQALPHVQGRGGAGAGLHRDRRCAALCIAQGHRRDSRRGARHPLRERRSDPVPSRAVARRGPRRPRRVERAEPRFPRGGERASRVLFREQGGCGDQHRAPVRRRKRSTRCAATAARARRRSTWRPARTTSCSTTASPAGVLAKVNPPVRSRADVEAMWEGIADGSIDTVGTDHVPRKRSHQGGQGHLGVEQRLPGRGHDAARSCSTKACASAASRPSASRRWRPPMRRASTAWQARARSWWDSMPTSPSWIPALTRTVDPATLESYADYSPFEGMALTGWPVATLRARPLRDARRRGASRGARASRGPLSLPPMTSPSIIMRLHEDLDVTTPRIWDRFLTERDKAVLRPVGLWQARRLRHAPGAVHHRRAIQLLRRQARGHPRRPEAVPHALRPRGLGRGGAHRAAAAPRAREEPAGVLYRERAARRHARQRRAGGQEPSRHREDGARGHARDADRGAARAASTPTSASASASPRASSARSS